MNGEVRLFTNNLELEMRRKEGCTKTKEENLYNRCWSLGEMLWASSTSCCGEGEGVEKEAKWSFRFYN